MIRKGLGGVSVGEEEAGFAGGWWERSQRQGGLEIRQRNLNMI